ncbi:MAG: TetR/AcrR family transcriptional regulator [Actinomycetota bacterium]
MTARPADLTAEAETPRTGSARERILETAGALFYELGFAAVGIDRIIAEAGVAKATLYAHFASKDDLVAAYLERSDEAFWDWIDGSLDTDADPADTLVRILELVEEQASSPTCRGCTFQVTAAEFPDHEHPAHRIAAAHKQRALDRFEALATEAGLRDPAQLAAHLLVLMDGAWAASRMFGAHSHVPGLGELTRTVVASHR